MNNPRCIRIFNLKEKAEYAQDVLKDAGIESFITEDSFGTMRLKDLNMQSRYRLYIDKDDIKKAGQFLAKKLKQTLPEN
jgi:hypothetical protein